MYMNLFDVLGTIYTMLFFIALFALSNVLNVYCAGEINFFIYIMLIKLIHIENINFMIDMVKHYFQNV